MTDEQLHKFNYFFVHLFNEILAWEEHTLKKLCADNNLTVREIHVIEAVATLTKTKDNTMAKVAKMLAVSRGSASTTINVLVNKGYLERSYTPLDRRVVFISLTDDGDRVNKIHEQFHVEMINMVGEHLSDDELDHMMESLDGLTKYFESKRLIRK